MKYYSLFIFCFITFSSCSTPQEEKMKCEGADGIYKEGSCILPKHICEGLDATPFCAEETAEKTCVTYGCNL